MSNAQFFAAQTVYTHVQRDWNRLGVESMDQIGHHLYKCLQDPNVSTAQFVTIKMCLALVIYTIKSSKTLLDATKSFCDSITEKMNSSDQNHRIYFAKLILWFLTYLPEEGQRVSALGQDGYQMVDLVKA